MNSPSFLRQAVNRFRRVMTRQQHHTALRMMAQQVFDNAPATDQRPIIFFDASTRLSGLSLNAGFAILSAWSLSLQGVPIVHFVCSAGLRPCVLGTNRTDPDAAPPCAECLRQSEAIFSDSQVRYFDFQEDYDLEAKLAGLYLDGLMGFDYQGLPLGE